MKKNPSKIKINISKQILKARYATGQSQKEITHAVWKQRKVWIP